MWYLSLLYIKLNNNYNYNYSKHSDWQRLSNLQCNLNLQPACSYENSGNLSFSFEKNEPIKYETKKKDKQIQTREPVTKKKDNIYIKLKNSVFMAKEITFETKG